MMNVLLRGNASVSCSARSTPKRISWGTAHFLVAAFSLLLFASAPAAESDNDRAMKESRARVEGEYHGTLPSWEGLTRAEALQKIALSPGEISRLYDRSNTRVMEGTIEHWRRFPNDPKRFDLVGMAVSALPHFWPDEEAGVVAMASKQPGNASVDLAQLAAWDRAYAPMRADVMVNADPASYWRRRIRVSELERVAVRMMNLRKADRVKDEVARELFYEMKMLLTRAIFDFSVEFQEGPDASASAALRLLWAIEQEDDPAAENLLLTTLAASPNLGMQAFANGHLQVRQFREKPISIALTAFDGGAFNLNQFRGKALYVAVWSNTCSSCIAEMPQLQALYEKYRSSGLEIVGIWCNQDSKDAPAQESTALSHLRRQGVSYLNSRLQGPELEEFLRKYHIIGFPVGWLFDREGLLVAADIHGAQLETQVRRVLGLSPEEASVALTSALSHE